jgi:hypothetical protein
MSTELLREPDGGEVVKADFAVKLQSDQEPPSLSEGKSLIREVEKLQSEVAALRTNITQLCQATRGLVTLISVLDKKVDAALKGGVGADCGVI